MAEPTAVTGAKSAEELTGWRRWITSAVLMIFTIAVALACIVVLSATLTQTRTASSALEGGQISISKLDYVGRNWARLNVVITESTGRLGTEKNKTADLTNRKTTTEAAKSSRFNDTEGKLVEFQLRVASIDAALVDRIRGKGHDVQVANISAARVGLIARDNSLAALIDGIEKAYRDYQVAQREAITAAANHKANEQSIKAQEDQLKWASDELDKQFELIKLGLARDKEARARVENAFYDLNINNFDCGLNNRRCGFFGGAINRGLYHLLTLRPDILTLLLVILMGVLGSALQITHAYFMKNEVHTIGGMFQKISVGAMTALVIFIVAKAGVPILADPARLGGEAPINPYFVSFLAIVSGLLSENAITNIQAQGAKIFGGDGEPNRWARRDLTLDLAGQNLKIADVAGYLGIGEDVARDMLQGKKAMEPAQQKIVTVCLRADPREIYTDIPPRQ